MNISFYCKQHERELVGKPDLPGGNIRFRVEVCPDCYKAARRQGVSAVTEELRKRAQEKVSE